MSVCRREGCGHSRHCHLVSGFGCTVKTVSGPPSPPDAKHPFNAPGVPDEELHPGRTVTRCPCTGFLE